MSVTRRNLLEGTAVLAAAVAAPGILRAQSQPIRIGVTVPSSGPMSFFGTDFLLGARLAAFQFNKNGGLLGRQIELVARDDKFSGASAIAAARDLAGMGINLQMGGTFTPMALAAAPILEELNSVFVCLAALTVSLTHENFVRNVFRPAANNYVLSRGLARSVLEKYRGVDKWQVVASDNAFGRDAAKMFGDGIKEYFPGLNEGRQAQVLEPMLVSATQTDFKTQILQLMDKNIEGIFLVEPGSPGLIFHRQSIQLGFDKKYKVILDVGNDSVAKQLGSDIPNNLWTYSYWPYQSDPVKSDKDSLQLLADYASMMGDRFPSSTVMGSCRQTRFLLEGIKLAKSTDTDAVIKGIEDVSFNNLGDTVRMRKEDHQGIGVSYFGKVEPLDAEPKWTFTDVIKVQDSTLVEPATPGKEFKL